MRRGSLLSMAATLLALSAASGLAQSNQLLTSRPGPGLFVDSLWGFAIQLPDNFVAKYHPHDSLDPQYDGYIGPEDDPISTSRFLAYHWRQFLHDEEFGNPPRFTADPDTIKQIVSYLCRRLANFTTAASNVENRVDSIVERKTASGLRMFLQYATQIVDYRDSDGGTTLRLPPTYYVAVPDGTDWTFLMIEGNFDPAHPPRAKLKTVGTIAKSVKAWRKE